MTKKHEDKLETNEEEIIDETDSSDETENTEEEGKVDGEGGDDKRIPYDRFKAKVDEVNALQKRLDKIEREQADKERKELEEQNRYKELYEEALKTIETQKENDVKRTKESLLKDVGYSDGQISRLVKLVDGDTEEEIKASIDELKADFPVPKKYADPSAGNGQGRSPEQVEGEEIGHKLFDRLLSSGRIKGLKK